MHFDEYDLNENEKQNFLKNKRKSVRTLDFSYNNDITMNKTTDQSILNETNYLLEKSELLNKTLNYLSSTDEFNIRNKQGEQIVINFNDDELIEDTILSKKIKEIKQFKDKKKVLENKEEKYDLDFIEAKAEDTGKLVKGKYYLIKL